MANHTPGPWRIEGHRSLANGAKDYIISHGVNSYGDGPEGYVARVEASKADATLIAAAPDFYSAALEALTFLNEIEGDGYGAMASFECARKSLQDAIAKAEGR
jgi:hypothetical protein